LNGFCFALPHLGSQGNCAGFGSVAHIFTAYSNLGSFSDTKMQDEVWIKTLEDGRKVKFSYLELPDHGAFITRSACR
jgi:hypothetical protein